MEYPDSKTYRKLYDRYFDSDKVEKLVSTIDSEKYEHAKILDLCGGGGCVSNYIKELYPASYVLLVDENELMTRTFFSDFQHRKYDIRISSISDFLETQTVGGESFNIAICRQAVNYWFDERTMQLLSSILGDGGVFVFNTFRNPPIKPLLKEYKTKNGKYTEFSYYDSITKQVHHFQALEGFAVHTTKFRYISKKEYKSVLKRYFVSVENYRNGNSVIYKCCN